MKSLSERFDKPGITTIAYVKMKPDTKVHKKVEIISETSKKIYHSHSIVPGGLEVIS